MRWPLSAGHWKPLVHRLPCAHQVALTFDDGPAPETTPHLLKLLAAHRAKATFFFSGIRAAQCGGLVQEAVAEGHVVYGHGWEHVNLEHDPARAVADMCRVEDLLSRYRATPSTYMLRLPYFCGWGRGAFHRAMAAFHPRVQFAWWSHCTADWLIAGRCRSRADLAARCRAKAHSLRIASDLPGGVVLLHEKAFDIAAPLNTEVAPLLAAQILDVLAERGLTGVSLPPASAAGTLRRWILTPMEAMAA